MPALSLYQSSLLAANNGEMKKAAVLATFARTAPLLAAMPMSSITGNSYAWVRETSLGTNAFRAINGSYTANNGTVETRTTALKAIGGDLDVDVLLVKAHGAQIRSRHEEMKAADLAQRIAYSMIKGSTTTIGGATADANGFDGLQVRYGGGFGGTAVSDTGENAAQIIANTGGSGALSMRDLDTAIQATESPTHLLMPKKQRVNIQAFLRNSSAIQMVKDDFGRLVTTYNGLPIIDGDVLGTVSGLEQLGYNEGASSNRASIYVLSMSDMGLHMVQNGGIEVRDLGEIDASPVFRTRIEWFGAMVDEHPRCVTRLYDIADAVAVA